jgi:hypothetical protein
MRPANGWNAQCSDFVDAGSTLTPAAAIWRRPATCPETRSNSSAFPRGSSRTGTLSPSTLDRPVPDFGRREVRHDSMAVEIEIDPGNSDRVRIAGLESRFFGGFPCARDAPRGSGGLPNARSGDRHAAVEHERVPGHVRGFRARQIAHGAGDILHRAESAERNPFDGAFEHLWIVQPVRAS